MAGVDSSDSQDEDDKNSDCRRALIQCLIALVIFIYCCLGGSLPQTGTLFRIPIAEAAVTCPVTPTGQDFSGKDLTNHNFHADPPGSLKGANFKNAVLKGTIFAGQDLTGASFEGANLGPSEKGSVDFSHTTLDKTCFINATMNATDFTYATIQCADFSNTSLIKAEFGPFQKIVAGNGCRTRFNGATLDVHAITTDNWGKTDFSNAQFQNLSPATFSLTNQDISGAILAGTNFSGIDMTGANLTDVDFSRTILTNAKLDNTTLNGSKLFNTNLKYASLICSRFYGSKADNQDNPNGKACTKNPDSSDPKRAADLTLATLQNADLSNATLNFVTLNGANLSGATLRNSSLIEATLEPTENVPAASLLGADLTGAVFSNAHINYVQFNNVILTGAVFDNKTTLAGTDFTGSIMPNVSFDQAILEGVNFHDTILQKAKFTNTTMKTIPFGGSGVSFTCTQLGGSNFKDANITAANFQAAVMPPAQDCCPQKVGDPWCGNIDITQENYGPVTYPVLNSSITCPNGDVAACKDAQWIIPKWQTDLCSSDRSTQTVWASPDCGTTPGEIVQFKDTNLKQCILASLPGKPSNVTVQTAAQIPQVDCPGRGIKDLSGLEKFTNLVKLDLTANQLTQFSLPFKKLSTLNIADNQLNFLDVSHLSSLIKLDAANNQLKAIVGMASVFLQILDVSHNQLIDFDLPIQNSLVYADLSDNKLTNVLDSSNPNLGQLTALSYLDLSNNSLTTFGSLQAIAYNLITLQGVLQSLFLECNPTFRCTSLQLDGQYSALQTSQCADFNSQSNQWIVLQYPNCSISAARGAGAR